MNLLTTVLALGLTIGVGAPEASAGAGAEDRVCSLPEADLGEDAACDQDEEFTPQTRTDAGLDPEPTEPSGCLIFGVGLHGAGFRVSGAGTARNPLQITIPVGSLLKAVIQVPYSPPNVRYEESFLLW